MNSFKPRLISLLRSYHDNTITEEETRELTRLLHQATDDELADLLRTEWEGSQNEDPFFAAARSDRMLNRIFEVPRLQEDTRGPAKKRLYVMLRKYAVAAAILIVTGFGIYLAQQPRPNGKQPVQQKETSIVSNDAPPGGDKATLTISNGKTIVLDEAENGVLTEMGNIRVNKTKDGQLAFQVTGNKTGHDITFNTLSTPRGGQYQVALPDGSKIWLNAASSLRFPSVFSGKERMVELTGEAYFEVATRRNMPFRVRSGTMEVEVLGTHFNIMAYEDESDIKTTLLEGSVKIKNGGAANILKPDQQAVLHKDGSMKVIRHVNVNEAIAWKNGLFEFNDADLSAIMRQASRWYDLDISYEGGIPQRRFTGKISRNAKASELISILRYSGIQFKIEGKKIIVTN